MRLPFHQLRPAFLETTAILAALVGGWGEARAAVGAEGPLAPPPPGDRAEAEEPEADDAGPRLGVAPQSATTHREYSEGVFDRLRRAFVEPYEASMTDPAELGESVSRWLTMTCRADADLGGAPSWQELYAEGDRLLEAGCVHPLVVSYAAHADLLRGRLARSRERHALASEPLASGEYGPLPRFYEAFRLMRLAFHNGAPQDHYVLERQAGEAWLELAAEEAGDAAAQRPLLVDFLQLTRQWWNRDEATALLTRAASDERLSPWLRAMLAGKEAYDRAWRIRGGGYANTVDEDDWRPFAEALGDARSHYELAYELQPDFPEAATEMLAVSLAEGDEETLRHWFDEARAAQVDYLPAYTAFLWGMRPRWHGSHAAMYALAQEWNEEGRFDTSAPFMAAQAVFDIGSERKGLADALRPEPPYRLVQSVLQQMADDPGNGIEARRSLARDALLTHRIGVALRSGRDDDAREALDTLVADGLGVNASILRSYDVQPELGVPRLYARTGKAAAKVRALGRLGWDAKRGDQEARRRSIADYAEAKRLTDDPRADAYFDHWERVFSLEVDFYDGKGASPGFDDSMNDWYRPVEGFWEVESRDAAIARQSDTSGAPFLWTECYLGTPYEVEFELELLEETCTSSRTGVFIGAKGDGDGRYFWLNRLGQEAGLSVGRDGGEVREVTVGAKNVVSARVWPGYGELWIDGELAVEAELEDFTPSGYFALASIPRSGGASEARYRNVRFRSIPPRADVPPSEGPEEPSEDDSASAE